METAIIILSAILLGMIAAVVCLSIAVIKAEKRIADLETRNVLREQFYKIDRNGDMQVFGSITCHGGDRNTYNNAL